MWSSSIPPPPCPVLENILPTHQIVPLKIVLNGDQPVEPPPSAALLPGYLVRYRGGDQPCPAVLIEACMCLLSMAGHAVLAAKPLGAVGTTKLSVPCVHHAVSF